MARSPFSKSITDNADATDLFFHGFLLCCWISLRLRGAGIVTDYLLQEEPCAVQAQIQSERNPLQYTRPNKEIREKIKSVASVLSVNSLSACGLSRRRRSTTMWYCLPDRQPNHKTTKQPNNKSASPGICIGLAVFVSQDKHQAVIRT